MEDETMGVFRGLADTTMDGTGITPVEVKHPWESGQTVSTRVMQTPAMNPSLLYKLEKYGPAPHPAFHEEIVDLLLQLAESDLWSERLAAAHHELTPHARIIMMLGDKNDRVRAAAEARMAYEDMKNGK